MNLEPRLPSPEPVLLLVEDDPLVRRYLRATLPPQGFRLLEAATVAEARRQAEQYTPDLVLLDLGLPDGDGLEVVSALRAWSAVPVLVLTARGAEAEKVRALDAGADDVLTKPFGAAELVARVRAAIRRSAQRATQDPRGVFRSGALEVDVAQRAVRRDGEPVRLTPTEWKLLVALVEQAGKVVTRTQLLTAVWGPGHATEAHYLRVYMAQLRRKLEHDAVRPRLLLTEPGVGYRLALEP